MSHPHPIIVTVKRMAQRAAINGGDLMVIEATQAEINVQTATLDGRPHPTATGTKALSEHRTAPFMHRLTMKHQCKLCKSVGLACEYCIGLMPGKPWCSMPLRKDHQLDLSW